MPSTILEIAHDAVSSGEINLSRPSTLFAASNEGDTTDRKLLRAVTKTCKLLSEKHDWSVSRRQKLHTTLAQETQTGMLPDDFLRFVPHTMFDRSRRLEVNGPVSPEQWQWMTGFYQAAATLSYTQRADSILFFPVPAAGLTIAFEYVSTNVGKDAGGEYLNRFTSDDDKPLWDDELMTLGTIFQLRKGEGYSYADEQREFELCMASRWMADGGYKTYNMAGGSPRSAEGRLSAMKSQAVVISNP